jgi:threonyl-tRNA synthetase
MAQEFDHKKLGKELDIYQIEDIVGKGLPLWLPNGAIIRKEIERYAEEMEFKYDYKRVATPHIAKESLYLKSQHLPAYEESMFPPMVVSDEEGAKERFFLKPMNCPHHHMIYSARKRSYRELPLRLAEYGTCYRFEQSGELSGLLRVRCLTMNDAHIYCRHDQLEQELKSVMRMYLEFYDTFKLSKYRFRLSLRGNDKAEKYKGDLEMWDKAGALLEKVLQDEGVDYFRAEGEAAFYGPKIDIQFKNLLGREETVSTIQVDFLSPKNFELAYVDDKGGESMPAIIHRAPLSTHERFVSFLLEYYGGAFPTWCAPVQVAMIPVNDDCLPYCQELASTLKGKMVRCEIDTTDNSFNKKIRNNTVRKIPIVLVVGNNEVEQRTVTVRRYGIKDQVTQSQDEFIAGLLDEIRERRMLREPMSSIT